jgi:MYXO-CTERM domain-containing protein
MPTKPASNRPRPGRFTARSRTRVRAGGMVALLLGLAAVAPPAHATRRILVWYADGGPPPASARKICFGTPPPFQCAFGLSVDDCRQQVQQLLDRWYGDFDAIFTHVPPTDSGPFDTVIVSSEGAWCGVDERTESRSPLPACTDMGSGSVAIFHCPDAKKCATLIAKEQAHIVGLQHTNSETDVMDERARAAHDGFEDRDNPSTVPRCGRLQNSYRLMLERLGTWPGGPKPEPGVQPPPSIDAGTPPPVDAAVDEDAPVNPDPQPDALDAHDDVSVPPFPPPDPGAPAKAPASGCSCALAATDATTPWLPLGAVLAVALWRLRRAWTRFTGR